MANIQAKPHRKQTICDIHRAMYRIIVARNPDESLIPLLQKAFDMAKKMGNKLRRHKYDYDESWWEIHKLDGGDLDSNGQE